MASFQARWPAGRDRRIPLGEIAVLELCKGELCRVGIHRRVDRLEGGGDGPAVLVTGEGHGMVQKMDNAGLDPRLGKGRLDRLRDRRQTVAPVGPRKLPEASARP